MKAHRQLSSLYELLAVLVAGITVPYAIQRVLVCLILPLLWLLGLAGPARIHAQDGDRRSITISAPQPPSAVALGDFDSDGLVDIAALSREDRFVTIYRNEGSESFTPRPGMPAGLGTLLFTTDIDGDDRADIVVGGGRSVMIGYGSDDGLLQVHQIPIHVNARSVALGDLNADGRLEIAAVGDSDGLVDIRMQISERQFAVDQIMGCPILAPHAIAIGDFNGDGIADMGVWGRDVNTYFAVYEGEGGGAFRIAELEESVLNPGQTVDMVMHAGDLDGDRDDELVLLHQPRPGDRTSRGKLLLVSGHGPGDYSAHHAGYVDGAWLHVADLDLDSYVDVVVSEGAALGMDGSGSVFILRNEATGALTFEIPCVSSFAGPGGIVGSGDLDGDGGVDLAVPLLDSIEVLYSPLESCAPLPTCFERQEPFEIPLPGQVVVEDFTGDEQADVVILAGGQGRVLSVEGPALREIATFPAPAVAPDAAAADIDGDGNMDIAVTNFAVGTVELHFWGETAPPLSPPVVLTAGMLPTGVLLEDLDVDGSIDVVVSLSGEKRIAVFLARAERAFSEARFFSAGDEPQGLAAGDVNGDAKPDIAVANAHAPHVSLLRGLGNGEFAPPETLVVVEDPLWIRMADVDGNGHDDIVTLSHNVNAVTTLLSQGDGFRPGIISLPPNALASALVVSDINRDGDIDILTANSGQRSVSVFRGVGAGDFDTRGETLLLGFGLQNEGALSLGTGDIDGDGFEDLVVGDTAGSRVHWFHALGCGTEPTFVRGDVDLSGKLLLNDAVLLLMSLFQGAGPLPCDDAADANDDGQLNLTDSVYSLSHLFLAGPPPPPPFPDAGRDLTVDTLHCLSR